MSDLNEKQIQNDKNNHEQSKNNTKKRLFNHDDNDNDNDNDNNNDNNNNYNDNKNTNFKNKKKKINNFSEFNDYYKEGDFINRCVECNIDLGPSNPRQLCGKTHCLLDNIEPLELQRDDNKKVLSIKNPDNIDQFISPQDGDTISEHSEDIINNLLKQNNKLKKRVSVLERDVKYIIKILSTRLNLESY